MANSSPSAPMAPLTRSNRPSIVGPDSPEHPYPLKLSGKVEKGFGRGAKELGIPTANLPDSSLAPLHTLNMTGIYHGFARVHPSSSGSSSSSAVSTVPPIPPQETLSVETIQSIRGETAPYPEPEPSNNDSTSTTSKTISEEDTRVWPMVMSVGWNPYYKNEKITAEVHIIHPFTHDFYGHEMDVLVLGYIRPELDYVSKEALIEDINTDVRVALASLAREGYAKYAQDEFLVRSQRG